MCSPNLYLCYVCEQCSHPRSLAALAFLYVCDPRLKPEEEGGITAACRPKFVC